MTFKDKLNKLFEDAIDVSDTVWYTPYETLYDAILRIYKENRDEIIDIQNESELERMQK